MRTRTLAALLLSMLGLAALGCPGDPDPSMQSTGTEPTTGPGSGSSADASADATQGSGPTTNADTGPSCETCGGTTCVDVTLDAEHCGACNQPCPVGIACLEGMCACPEGTMPCGDACVDTSANGAHCGGCDQPCEGGTVCLDGACGMGCGALTECSGGCVDTSVDPLHCGGCDQPCPSGAACEGAACACPGPPLSYASDIGPMFVEDCTGPGCHGAPMPQEGLDLRAGSGYASLVDVASAQCGSRLRVAPGDPDASYLLDKLLGVDLCMGNRMPKADTPYAADRIDLVTAWICQGAPP